MKQVCYRPSHLVIEQVLMRIIQTNGALTHGDSMTENPWCLIAVISSQHCCFKMIDMDVFFLV